MEVIYPQLWIFDFILGSWTCVEAGEGGGGGKRGGNANGGSLGIGAGPSPGPPAVFDHTATLVGGKRIIVVGGAMVGTALNKEVCFRPLPSTLK